MRILIAGGGSVGRKAAIELIEEGHTIVIIDKDTDICQNLKDELDAVILHGDASRPDILEEAEIKKCEEVVAATNSDQDNLVIMVIAREYKVKRIIVRFDDPSFNSIGEMLGVHDIINPKVTAAQRIVDLTRGQHLVNLNSIVRGNARLFSTTIRKKEHIDQALSELELPKNTLPIGIYRRDEFLIPTKDMQLLEGDRVTLITEASSMVELEELFDLHEDDE